MEQIKLVVLSNTNRFVMSQLLQHKKTVSPISSQSPDSYHPLVLMQDSLIPRKVTRSSQNWAGVLRSC